MQESIAQEPQQLQGPQLDQQLRGPQLDQQLGPPQLFVPHARQKLLVDREGMNVEKLNALLRFIVIDLKI